MDTTDMLEATISDVVHKGRGILAADESTATITKRFKEIDTESTAQSRCDWRTLLVTTPELGAYISAIILYEESLSQQATSKRSIPEAALQQKIVPGIKVDKGYKELALSHGDFITMGLDDLEQRLQAYKAQGARFAKWREVYKLEAHLPSRQGIEANAEMLARYAAVCQAEGVVPIVEPEVLMDGQHEIDRHASVTEAVLQAVFAALNRHRVQLEHIILKPNMVLPGKEARTASPQEVAAATLKVLKRTVPAAVPSINFLSGGQEAEEATQNLNEINRQGSGLPWLLSLSFGRALQQPALQLWRGKAENIEIAQTALLKRAKLNHLAMMGTYESLMELE